MLDLVLVEGINKEDKHAKAWVKRVAMKAWRTLIGKKTIKHENHTPFTCVNILIE